ncbi:ferrous iron transporter B [Verminephrobacter aporrectodeae subsp. tuberculatae]|uniref:Ferrous iron transport protein B n=2 Tax=Verminephrobacter TaxID=364316 RepID=A0ABT3KWW1_9BURK|nr:ferrous iron transporter B [Verminephrobacter aporrectodeae]MCW5223259.1 ferrous iron transporter B [Verminephrobacter aporrectodeae subsp. tuberculatae]MCW5256530.1 ferrous iron transporter B [Verminephrobacter aporrectodeae subsp. tuberculatae]MCW5288723.1 ferrous iron transporter B [Verminephrobacter aporrectodeae subsp. tuberculatae]MCW5322310.1 ferrous iron transporter B [Verminephrobacter aporrectodeae subsp. tuberculatae]MCW8166140.1 ferrous iron transporter B [Verminephrobacter apor
MSTQTLATPPLRIALLGTPNCGKTALFNLLTGARQKVANYAGVTVERKEGLLQTASGRRVRVLDLPGAYSLHARSLDEAITRDIVRGARTGEPAPDVLVCVTDATNLRLNLRLVLEVRALGLPMVLVLNMMDLAEHQGIAIDRAVLERELGLPVLATVGVRGDGARELLQWLETMPSPQRSVQAPVAALPAPDADGLETQAEVIRTHEQVRRIMGLAVRVPARGLRMDDRIDALLLHPVWGLLVLAATLFLMFQAVFSWSELPKSWIEAGMAWLTEQVNAGMGDGPLRSLLTDGVLAGAGSVLVFLPQILFLFLFILALEDSGYLPRAAFLLDRVMGTVGLSGRSFIPLLSSFACAVPGVMATRSITQWRERLVTIMIAPLMTCSARLPVYALLIAAFIPERTLAGVFNLQGVVLFSLYLVGIASAMAAAAVTQLARSDTRAAPLMMELPAYRWPSLRNLAFGLYERAMIFIGRVGGIILAITVLLWFLSTYPAAPPGAQQAAITYSYAGQLGRWLEPIVAPIGFNWQIAIALIPGMAAREVAVSALGTVYALSATGDEAAKQLEALITGSWSLATALSLMAWYVFAPQCISTIAAVRRETNSWRYPLLMTGYLFVLAYGASYVTYRVALALGGGA